MAAVHPVVICYPPCHFWPGLASPCSFVSEGHAHSCIFNSLTGRQIVLKSRKGRTWCRRGGLVRSGARENTFVLWKDLIGNPHTQRVRYAHHPAKNADAGRRILCHPPLCLPLVLIRASADPFDAWTPRIARNRPMFHSDGGRHLHPLLSNPSVAVLTDLVGRRETGTSNVFLYNVIWFENDRQLEAS